MIYKWDTFQHGCLPMNMQRVMSDSTSIIHFSVMTRWSTSRTYIHTQYGQIVPKDKKNIERIGCVAIGTLNIEKKGKGMRKNMDGLCISFTWCLRRRRDGIWSKIVFHRHHLGTISQIVYRQNITKKKKRKKMKEKKGEKIRGMSLSCCRRRINEQLRVKTKKRKSYRSLS